MAELKCPECGAVFKVDEGSYDRLVRQIKNSEFQKELEERLAQQQHLHETQLKVLQEKSAFEKEKLVSDYERKLETVRRDDAEDKTKAVNELEKITSRLQSRIDNNEHTKALEITQAIQQKTEEIARKNEEIQRLEVNLRTTEERLKSFEVCHAKELKLLETQAASSQNEAVRQAEDRLKEEQSKALQAFKESCETQLKLKDEELERIKNYKSRLSTKMIGESLEQFCETEFNKLRAAAFPNAYFEKDNDAHSGSKCDFIFREKTEEQIEFISIAFEMKNEVDATVVKHKNEDFFKKLDRDRTEKHCEYAVLVSCLEQDSELYNTGIVDVSYKFPKMYVVRPQFFIPILSLLRNEALNSVRYKRQLAEYQNRNIDVTNFEKKLSEVKNQFETNFNHARKKFNDAVAEIDKSIEHLQKIKEALLLSEKHLGHANHKLQDVTVRKLTYGNPTMQKMFKETEGS